MVLAFLKNILEKSKETIVAFFVHPDIWKFYLEGLIFSFLTYLFYVEFGPGMGGILLRPNEKGESKFRLTGIMPLLRHPFENIALWSPANWDLNFITFCLIGATFYAGVRYKLSLP